MSDVYDVLANILTHYQSLFFISFPFIGILYTLRAKTSELLESVFNKEQPHLEVQANVRLPVSCRVSCYICDKRLTGTCESCVENSVLWEECFIPQCVGIKKIGSCERCPVHDDCATRREYTQRCVFEGECMVELLPEDFEAPESKNYETGRVLFFKSQSPDDAFISFSNFIKRGFQGLCITRMHPDVWTGKYNLPLLPTIRILSSTNGCKKFICTNDPDQILSLIKKFIKKNPAGVILLQGPEYINSDRGFVELLQFIQTLKNIASITRTQFIIALNPDVFTCEEVEAFERNPGIDKTVERVAEFITGDETK